MPNKETEETEETAGFVKLLRVMKALRAPDGCPWDKAQDHDSLRTYMLREAYEVVDAIEEKDMDNLCEELGDVLYQIVFHAQIAAENGEFTMDDVARGIADKMIERHPFVFDTADENEAENGADTWEQRKFSAKKREHLLSGVPKSLPSLLYACIMQTRVDSMCHANAKSKPIDVSESFLHAKEQAAKCETSEERECLLGYMLFETVRFIRAHGIDPESALHRYNHLYAKRFGELEDHFRAAGEPVTHVTEAMLQKMENEIAFGAHRMQQESPAK